MVCFDTKKMTENQNRIMDFVSDTRIPQNILDLVVELTGKMINNFPCELYLFCKKMKMT